MVSGSLVDDVSSVEEGSCDKCDMEDREIVGVGHWHRC